MKNIISKPVLRKIAVVATVTSLLMIGSSCGDFFEENLYNKYATRNYFESVAKLNMAVLGVYAQIQHRYSYGQGMLAYDNDTDVTHINGTDLNSSNQWRDIGHYHINTGETALESTWQVYYEGIGRANTVLDNYTRVPINSDAEQTELNKLVAETKVLRGMMYFDLVRLFGDVPLVLEATELTDNFLLPRTAKEQVYAQIVQDMREAIPDLPWHDDPAFAYNYRITRGGAMGLLARVWLTRGGYSLHQDRQIRRPDNYREYYQEVLNITEELILSGRHGLTDDFETIFRDVCNDRKQPREILLEIDFVYQPGYGYIEGYIGTWNAILTANIPNVIGRANAFIRTQKKYYDMFGEGDLRRDVTIGTYQIVESSTGSGIAVISQYSNANSHLWGLGKWRREWQEDIAKQMADQSLTDINYILVRYSDVLLMRAEALNEINEGPTDEAIELVNQVRRRGYGRPIITPDSEVDMPSTITGKDAFLAYLQDERARELGTEAVSRRMDLIRWNLLGEKIREMYEWCVANNGVNITLNFVAYGEFQTGRNELYPIPLREMNQNRSLVQNPGY